MRYSTPFSWNEGDVVLDCGVIAAFREHGISPELFEEWVQEAYPEGSLSYQVLIARAYDNAHGTQTCEELPSVLNLPDFDRLE